jgi:hypothetical protein
MPQGFANTPGYQDILNLARAGHLTNQELTAWVLENAPSVSEVSNILSMAKVHEPKTVFGIGVSGGQLVISPNNPATKPQAPSLLGPNPLNPLNPGGAGAGSQDWQHLLVRIGEFLLGLTLVGIGIYAVLRNTQPYQDAKKVVMTTAAVVPK